MTQSTYTGPSVESKYARWSFCILTFAFAVAAFVRLPLSWNGVHRLFLIIENNTIYPDEERYTTHLIQMVTLIVRRTILNINLLSLVFSLSYCFSYILLIHLCLKITSSKVGIRYRIWPFLSFCLTGIWLQIYFVSEMNLASLLAWPLFLQLLLNKTVQRLSVALALALFFLHPTSALFFLFFGGVALADKTRVFRIRECLFWWGAALMRFGLFTNRQPEMEMTNLLHWHSVRHPFPVLPLVGCVFAYFLGIVALLRGKIPRRVEILLGILSAVVIGVSGILWALSPSSFLKTEGFTLNTTSLSLIFMFICWLDSRLIRSTKPLVEQYSTWGVLFSSGLCSLIILIMAFHWNYGINRFVELIEKNPKNCIEVSEFSPHFSIPALSSYFFPTLSLIYQNTLAPRKIVVENGECSAPHFIDSIRVGWWDPRFSRASRMTFDFSKTGL